MFLHLFFASLLALVGLGLTNGAWIGLQAWMGDIPGWDNEPMDWICLFGFLILAALCFAGSLYFFTLAL